MTYHALAFCGMPGTAADLKILRFSSQKLTCDLQIYGVASVEGAVDTDCGENPICIGYSRGCWNAMRYASKYPAAGVLLIAPHWGNRISLWLRLLLCIPILGTALLCIAGPRSIRKMLQETAFPSEIPAAYQALENIYVQTSILRSAMLSPVYSTAEAQALVQSLHVPVHVIAGERDKALHIAKELKPWLKRLTVVPNAGHALPWTHGNDCVKALNRLIGEL